MKLSKKILLLIIFFILIYFIGGLIFHISYKISPPQSGLNKQIVRQTTKIATKLSEYKIDRLYFFNDSFLFKNKATFILDFSRNDLIYNDSIIGLIKGGEVKILEDRFKKWRNFQIIYKNKIIKAKYKFHGSSVTPYLLGYQSYTIKSKSAINGSKHFKLLTGNEFNYLNIFNNILGNKNDLIVEDFGSVVIVNQGGALKDFLKYSVFNEKYITKTYSLKEPLIIRRNTFNKGGGLRQWHSSKLDDLYYNIDKSNIDRSDLDLWAKFTQSPSELNYNSSYMGKFIALIQFYGNPHQITGNNDKWILSDSMFYPVYRNESGPWQVLTVDDLENNLFFDLYYYSASLDIYKKILTDENVLYERNKALKRIIDSQDEIISDLDSVYLSNVDKHRRFNEDYLKLSLSHIKSKKIFKQNSNTIGSYLNQGYTMISYDGDNLKLKSSKVNQIQIEVSDSIYIFNPTIHKFNNEFKKLTNTINEFSLHGVSNIDSLKIKDLVLNKYLLNEKDYHIITIN
ncbi:hypothetical protein N9600_06105 [Flavobacteriaceae bacterium]|nr:hypothetical protein [Flavobacteriaceae bacterium]